MILSTGRDRRFLRTSLPVSDPVEKLKNFTKARGDQGFESLYRNLKDVSQGHEDGRHVDKEQCIKALSGFGYPVTSKEMGDVFDAIDKDKKGVVDYRSVIRDLDSANYRKFSSSGSSSRSYSRSRGDRDTSYRLDFMERKWLSELADENHEAGESSRSSRRFSEDGGSRRQKSHGRPRPNYYKDSSETDVGWLNKWHDSMNAPDTSLERRRSNPFNLSDPKSGQTAGISGTGGSLGRSRRRSDSMNRRPTAARYDRARSTVTRGRYRM